MDQRARTLRQYFPDADDSTRLAILGQSQRLVIGNEPLQLTEYQVGDGETMYAAYSKETNTIYIRLIDLSFFTRKKK